MDLKRLGKLCREYRINNDISIEELATKSHYSVWSIYAFEQGRMNNASILLVYMSYGFTLDRRTICRTLTSC